MLQRLSTKPNAEAVSHPKNHLLFDSDSDPNNVLKKKGRCYYNYSQFVGLEELYTRENAKL